MTEFGKRDLIAQKQILSYGQKNDDGVDFSILRLSNYTSYSYCLLCPGGWFTRSMDSQHPGSSKPMPLLNLLLSGVICMCRASLIFNSRFLLALSTTLTSSHLMGRASENRELTIKEALHKQMTPDNNKFNRDIGLELPGCWLSMLHANHSPGHNKQ